MYNLLISYRRIPSCSIKTIFFFFSLISVSYCFVLADPEIHILVFTIRACVCVNVCERNTNEKKKMLCCSPFPTGFFIMYLSNLNE